jgi:hypothetical protein
VFILFTAVLVCLFSLLMYFCVYILYWCTCVSMLFTVVHVCLYSLLMYMFVYTLSDVYVCLCSLLMYMCVYTLYWCTCVSMLFAILNRNRPEPNNYICWYSHECNVRIVYIELVTYILSESGEVSYLMPCHIINNRFIFIILFVIIVTVCKIFIQRCLIKM